MRLWRRLVLAVLVLLAGWAGAVRAGEAVPPATVDDRSDAAALVRSLYNAVTLKDYARAWGYFGVPPARDFASFVKGYAATEFVAVKLGPVAAEGAAGSSYYSVPVALAAHEQGDTVRYFAGCYVVRGVNGAIQEPPYNPLHIEQAKLKPVADFAIPDEVAKSCGGAVATDAAAALERVQRQFAAEQRVACGLDDEEAAPGALRTPEVHDLSFKFASDEAAAKPRHYRLYHFPCQLYAYNESSVFYLEDDMGAAQPVSFAEPVVEAAFADDEQTRLSGWKVTGFTATATLINADFDTANQTITSFAKGRGIGDIFSSGSWDFAEGSFRLRGWLYDPTADEQEDPVTVIRDGVVQPPDLPK